MFTLPDALDIVFLNAGRFGISICALQGCDFEDAGSPGIFAWIIQVLHAAAFTPEAGVRYCA
jgi:hypothetical protein